jgi:hypothetical protein
MEYQKSCIHCKIIKPIEHFYKHPTMKDGRFSSCKQCIKNKYELDVNTLNINQKQRYTIKENLIKRAFTGSISRAKRKNLLHTISKSWFQNKIDNGICELTGLPFDFDFKISGVRCRPYLPSIDRIDCSKGYEENNCRVVLYCVNYSIGDYGLTFMQPIFKKLAEIPIP